MVMEVDSTIPFRPTDEEKEEDPFFLFGEEAIDDEDDDEIEIPYMPEELTPAQKNLSNNALMRFVADMDPVELDDDTKFNELSDRTKKALQWVEKGLGERGKKLSGIIRESLANAPHDDFETMETMIESAYTVGGFFQDLPEATADVGFRIGDDFINAYSAVALHGAGLGFMYEDQSALDDLIPDSDNPLTKVYKEMAEWYGNYVALGGIFGKGAKLLSKKELALSSMATYLSTDSAEEDFISMYSASPTLGKLATEWKELAADGGGVVSPAVIKKFKQTVVGELTGLAMIGGAVGSWELGKQVGRGAKKAADVSGLSNWGKKNVEKLADFFIERLKIIDAKAKLDNLKLKGDEFLKDETGTVRLGFGDDVPADDFVKMDDLAKGVEDADERTVLFNISEMDINDTNAINKLNIPDAKSVEQIREEVAGALYSLEKKLAPGETLDPKSYKMDPLPKEAIKHVKYETYLQARKNIISQGARKIEFHFKEPKIKAAKDAKEAERIEKASIPEPEHEHVTFSDKPHPRWESKRQDNYMTITNKGIRVKASAYREPKDFKKAVSEATHTQENYLGYTPISVKKYTTKFDKSVENERRGRVGLDVVKDFADTIGLNKDEVFKLLRERPQGLALTNEEVFIAREIIVAHIDDVNKQIKALAKRDPEMGLQSIKISDAEILELMDQIDDLYDTIIPSFLAGVSESARAMRTFALVKGPQMRRNARQMSMRLQSFGGKESARTRLGVFGNLVDSGDLAVARKVAKDGYGNLLDRLFNVGIQLRANNLVSSTYSLSKNFLSGLAMTGKYVADQTVEPLITLFRRRNDELPIGAASLSDYVGAMKGITHALSETTSMFGTHLKHLFDLTQGPKSFFDPQFTRLGPESTMFGKMSPESMADKKVGKAFETNANTGVAERMVRVIELMAEAATFRYAGFKAQMMNDEVFKTFITTLHFHLLAGREAGRRVRYRKSMKSAQTLDWATEYKKVLDNPGDDTGVKIMQEAMDRGREATFTLPIIPETAPSLHALYSTLLRSEKSPALRKIQTLIVPFATPALNVARSAVSSNLLTGRIWRIMNSKVMRPHSKLILDQPTTDHLLAQEITGTFFIGSLIYGLGENRLVTGSAENDPAQEKLRRESGLLSPHDSVGISQEDGVVKWYDISKIDIIGRQIILAKNIGRLFERMSSEEVEQSQWIMGKILGKYVSPELFLDMLTVGKALLETIGLDGVLPGNNPKGENTQRMKQWLAGAMAQTTVPFYSFWKEQRKANNNSVLSIGGGQETAPITDWQTAPVLGDYEDEDLPMISQLEKGVSIMEMFYNELNQVFGKSEEVPFKPNMWGDAILLPYQTAALELSYEVPDFISALLEGIEQAASNIPVLGSYVPAIEDDVTNVWKLGEYRIGYDEQWLGEGGLADAVMDPVRRGDLDTLAENIVRVTERNHPKLITNANRKKKVMQARVFLELEALRAKDTQLTKQPSTITSLMPSDRMPVSGLTYSKMRDTVTLHPRDFNEFIKIMNQDGLAFNQYTEEEVEALGPSNFDAYKGSYLQTMYDLISSNYNGSVGYESALTPQEMYHRLRKIQRHYMKMARIQYMGRGRSMFFNEIQSKLDTDQTQERLQVEPLME